MEINEFSSKQLAEKFEEFSKATLEKYDVTPIEKRDMKKTIDQFEEALIEIAQTHFKEVIEAIKSGQFLLAS